MRPLRVPAGPYPQGMTTSHQVEVPTGRDKSRVRISGLTTVIVSLALLAGAVLVAALPVSSSPPVTDCGYAALPSEVHNYNIIDSCQSALTRNRTLSTMLVTLGAAGLTVASIRARRWYSAIGVAFSVFMLLLAWFSMYRYR